MRQQKAVKFNPRQRQIVGLLGQGLSNKDIAAKLQLAETTVRTYVCTILKLVSATNRTQLALYAVKHGLVTGPLVAEAVERTLT